MNYGEIRYLSLLLPHAYAHIYTHKHIDPYTSTWRFFLANSCIFYIYEIV